MWKGGCVMTGLSLYIVVGILAAASLLVALRWEHDFPRGPMPIIRRPFDNQRHTLTLMGQDGRPNPLRYEIFPTYFAALSHQRRLTSRGQASIITHTESGEVRVDFATMFGPFGRIYY